MKHIFVAILLMTCLWTVWPADAIAQKVRSDDYLQRPAPPVSDEARKGMEAELAKAQTKYEANSHDPDATIWLGRRLAYLGRFREAIEVYTRGIKEFPKDPRFYRHRGHRFITVRRFSEAIADLKKAAQLTAGKPDEIEPDGQPNARNIPTSTLQFNIWYHLGLAQYLNGNYQEALTSYRECLKVSDSPDRMVATTHWLYMTLRLLKSEQAAEVLKPIDVGMDVIENEGYYRLLLMYKGQISADALLADASKQGNSPGAHSMLYGIGNWYRYNGNRKRAIELFRQIISSDQWTSFGYIAAETAMRG